MTLDAGGAGRSYLSAIHRLPPPPPPPPAQANQGLPAGNGSFASQVQGTAPDPANDQLFAMMANGAYAPDSPEYAQKLEAAGWSRLEAGADGNSLVDAQGNRIEIDPDLLSDDRSGFHAEIYQHEDGHYVVAYRGSEVGTEQSQLMDWVNNAQQGLGMDSSQYSAAMELAAQAEQVFGDGNVALTGHSLGGGLASAASLYTGAPAVTFNASGLSNQTLESLNFNPNQARASMAEDGQVRRYAVNGDPLTLAQEDIPVLPLVGSPPEAIGHALRINAPPGTSFGGLHGGGGGDASYVDAFDHAAPYDPASLPSPSQLIGDGVNGGIDAMGDAAAAGMDALGRGLQDSGRLDGWLAGMALSSLAPAVDRTVDALGDAVGAGIGFAGDTLHAGIKAAGDFQFNTLASAIREGLDFGRDLAGTGAELVDGLKESVDHLMGGDVVKAGAGALGHLLDAGTDALGDLTDGALAFAGDTIEGGADAFGGFMRDLGERTGWDRPADSAARFVEGAGDVVSDIADSAGKMVDNATDAFGDGLEAVSDVAGSVGQGVNDFLSGRWFR